MEPLYIMHSYCSFLQLILTTHSYCSFLLLIFATHFYCSFLLLIINVHSYYSFSLLILNSHSQYSFALLFQSVHSTHPYKTIKSNKATKEIICKKIIKYLSLKCRMAITLSVINEYCNFAWYNQQYIYKFVSSLQNTHRWSYRYIQIYSTRCWEHVQTATYEM